MLELPLQDKMLQGSSSIVGEESRADKGETELQESKDF